MEQLATNPLVLRTATLSPIRELSKSASPRQGRLYQALRRTDRTTAEAASGFARKVILMSEQPRLLAARN